MRKYKNNMKNKIFAFFLIASMLIGCLPGTAFPANDTKEEKDGFHLFDLAYHDKDFTSERLIVESEKEPNVNNGEIIGQLDDAYLLQFDSEADAKKAYTRYNIAGKDVFIDGEVKTADTEEKSEAEATEVSKDNNAFVNVAEISDDKSAEIALIDTGVSSEDIERYSVIDDKMSGKNSHGDDMLFYITAENPDADIVSIRALDDNGIGSVSDIYAAIKLAEDMDVEYINLSIYANATKDNECINDLIEEAQDNGITVVGAAGNDGADASGYIPGKNEKATIVGSSTINGERREFSNFGETVDYYVPSESTSEAAARITGVISSGQDINELIKEHKLFTKANDVNKQVEDESEANTEAGELPTNVYRPLSDLSNGRWKNLSDQKISEYYWNNNNEDLYYFLEELSEEDRNDLFARHTLFSAPLVLPDENGNNVQKNLYEVLKEQFGSGEFKTAARTTGTSGYYYIKFQMGSGGSGTQTHRINVTLSAANNETASMSGSSAVSSGSTWSWNNTSGFPAFRLGGVYWKKDSGGYWWHCRTRFTYKQPAYTVTSSAVTNPTGDKFSWTGGDGTSYTTVKDAKSSYKSARDVTCDFFSHLTNTGIGQPGSGWATGHGTVTITFTPIQLYIYYDKNGGTPIYDSHVSTGVGAYQVWAPNGNRHGYYQIRNYNTAVGLGAVGALFRKDYYHINPATAYTRTQIWHAGQSPYTQTSGTYKQWNASGSPTYTPSQFIDITTGNNWTYYGVILQTNWQPNTVSVSYNANGGVISDAPHNGWDNYWFKLSGSTVQMATARNGSYDNFKNTFSYNNNINPTDVSTMNLTKKGYHVDTADMWNTRANGTGTSMNSATNAWTDWGSKTAADTPITVYANWKANNYTVTYDKNAPSGKTVTGTTANSSHTYDKAATLTKNGYALEGWVFNGWNTKADGTGTEYTDRQSVTNLTDVNNGTVTLYAQWREKSTVTVHYVESATGKKISTDKIYDGFVPDVYRFAPKDISGYTITNGGTTTTGRYVSGGSEATFWYRKTVKSEVDTDQGILYRINAISARDSVPEDADIDINWFKFAGSFSNAIEWMDMTNQHDDQGNAIPWDELVEFSRTKSPKRTDPDVNDNGEFEVTLTYKGKYADMPPSKVILKLDDTEMENEDTEQVDETVDLTDDLQKVNVVVKKQDQDGNPIAGAKFQLKALVDIQNSYGTTIYKAGTVIATAVSKGDGSVDFETDLPTNVFSLSDGDMYEITEIEAPRGYIKSNKVYRFDGAPQANKEYTIFSTTMTNVSSDHPSINKIWNDKMSNATRPTSITIRVKKGDTVVKTVTMTEAANKQEDDSWYMELTDLPLKENGQIIDYTFEEVVPAGYIDPEITYENGVAKIINTGETPESVPLTVKKVWNDNNNQDGIRPARVEVDLHQFSIENPQDQTIYEPYTTKTENGQETKVWTPYVLSASNNWTLTVSNLPTRRSDGALVDYAFVERQTDIINGNVTTGYKTSVKEDKKVTTITNTHTSVPTNATLTKIWHQAKQNNYENIPDSIRVQLLQNGRPYTGSYVDQEGNAKTNQPEITISKPAGSTDTWEYSVTELPMFANGKKAEYSFKEIDDAIPVTLDNGSSAEWVLASSTTKDISTEIINDLDYLKPELKSLTVHKSWEDMKYGSEAENREAPKLVLKGIIADNADEFTIRMNGLIKEGDLETGKIVLKFRKYDNSDIINIQPSISEIGEQGSSANVDRIVYDKTLYDMGFEAKVNKESDWLGTIETVHLYHKKGTSLENGSAWIYEVTHTGGTKTGALTGTASNGVTGDLGYKKLQSGQEVEYKSEDNISGWQKLTAKYWIYNFANLDSHVTYETVTEEEYKGYDIFVDGEKTNVSEIVDNEAFFTNKEIEVQDLTIRKIVTGNLGNKEKNFNFSIEFKGLPAGKIYETSEGQTNRVSADGTLSVEFTLSHDQVWMIKELPVGAEYTVRENATDFIPYETSWEMQYKDANGATQIEEIEDSKTMKLVGDKEEVSITCNNHAETLIPTGVSGGYWYIIIILIMAGGAAAVLLARRKKQ